MARWPVVLWALINVVLRIKRPYMITPKGKAAVRGPRSITIYGPYVFLGVFPLVAIWVFNATGGAGDARGYYGLALINAVLAGVVLATTLGMDIKQIAVAQRALTAGLRARAGMLLALACLAGLLGLSVAAFGHEAIHAMIQTGGRA